MLSADAQYEALAVIRNHEVTSRWTISSFFSILETGLMYFALTTLDDQLLLLIPACFMGVIISVLWRCLLKKINAWLTFWNSRLAELEQSNEGVPVFSRTHFQAEAEVPRSIGSDVALLWVSSIFFAAWVGIAIMYALVAFKS